MKSYRLPFLFILLIAVLSFSSCLNSDSESQFDWYEPMTVSEDRLTMIGDYTNNRYYIQNSDILQLVDNNNAPTGEYVKRGVFYVKFMDGESINDQKKEYKVNIFTLSAYPVKNMTMMSDTIEHSNKFYKLGRECWAVNGYINVAFAPTYKSGEKLSINDFNLYIEKVEGSTIHLVLNHNISEVENPTYYEDYLLISFKMPSKYEVLHKFPDLEFIDSSNTELNPNGYSDLVNIKVTAKGLNDSTQETNTFQARLDMGY